MAPSALALVVACAVAWSLLDLLRKGLAGRATPTALLVALTLGQVPLMAAWTALSPGGPVGRGYLAPAAASVALNLVANLAFLEALRVSSLSLTVPLLSLTPAFTALLAIPVLGEVPSAAQLAGILLVTAGVLALHLESGAAVSLAGLWRGLARERGSRLMLLVAFCWSLAPALDKLAMVHAGAPLHGLVLNAGVGLGALAVLASRRRLGELRGAAAQAGALVLTVVVAAAAIGLQLLALQRVWVAVVETCKRAVGSSLALAFGRRLLGETVGWPQLAGVALTTAGVAMILLLG